MKLLGVGKVNFLKKVSPKLTSGQLSVSCKVGENDWEYVNYKIKFIGESLIQLKNDGVKDGDRIDILDSFLGMEKYKNKNGETVINQVVTVTLAQKYDVSKDNKVGGEETPF